MIKFDKKDRKKARRMYTDENPLGFLLFDGVYDSRQGAWLGQEYGIAANREEAEAFLKGKPVIPFFIRKVM